ncbi:hypothetical protein Y032_0016g3070 [Ancylostoma ceylanicum]|nr:hypothetical protein Y032_0016g3070 [Ancylostoma ceylanicum]
MERKTKRLEKKKQEVGEAVDKNAKKRLERDEERLKATNRDMSMFKMKSMFAIGLAFTALLSTFNSIFDGRVVARLPFVPIGFLQGLSHRNLEVGKVPAVFKGLFFWNPTLPCSDLSFVYIRRSGMCEFVIIIYRKLLNSCATANRKMHFSKQYICDILVYEFKSGKSATVSSRGIDSVFGDGAVTERPAHDWTRSLRVGDSNLNVSSWPGRVSGVENSRLRHLVGKDPNDGTIRFLPDNARSLTIRVTHQKLLDFGWEVLTSPLYKTDLAPKDYQLLLTLFNAFLGKACDDEGELDRWLSNFFRISDSTVLYRRH